MSTHTSVEALHVLKLLTRRQREQALAHPDLPQLAIGTPLPDTLMWLHQRQIVTPEDVTSLLSSVARHFSGDELALRLSILQQLVEALNRVSLDHLRDETLITQELYQRALAHLPGDVLLPTPGEALNWMLHVGLLPRAEFKSMSQRTASGGSDEAKRMVQHAQARQDEHKKAVRGAILDGLFPGSRLIWVIVAPLALAGMVWYVVSGNSVPGCDSTDTITAVTRMLNKAAPEGTGKASLHDVKEAGYAASHNIRGCLATIMLDGEKMDYAYTVARDDSGSKRRISYAGARPLLVQARFGAIEDGDFAQQAKPLGREALEKAFRDGMEGARIMPRPRQAFSLTQSMERTREIAEIEPLAPCKEISPGVYSCRLLIERNDAVLSMLNGGSAVMQEGDFTFQRSSEESAGKGWSVTPQFAGELRQATVKE
ncbi:MULTISPECIES: hypothetical protein [unclassified Janthinobacterium]|uniref:hypothetical protein n=1 Tax=unclassified Janthinobacterium TaxID=2610881 RepID=UPI001E2984F3|nr:MULTISPECIES: hypothetical protein [unclassified Janthinobacterium]MCC7645265.1 hypothetical protein [Janthinobacterium sp. EB271-G4-3-1]MCC7693466.1 hypothetical protein [Janthinobacterium sp. EB271-G4-3-2]